MDSIWDITLHANARPHLKPGWIAAASAVDVCINTGSAESCDGHVGGRVDLCASEEWMASVGCLWVAGKFGLTRACARAYAC